MPGVAGRQAGRQCVRDASSGGVFVDSPWG